MEIVEDRRASLEPSLVVCVCEGDALENAFDARFLRPLEFRIFQVDVVDDLTDRRQSRFIEACALGEHLERAAIAFMRELAAEHVEAELALARFVSLAGHELESRGRIDEAADEPRARHP